ncbi:hypothetical protein Nmel_013628 [Mimus melanotis]
MYVYTSIYYIIVRKNGNKAFCETPISEDMSCAPRSDKGDSPPQCHLHPSIPTSHYLCQSSH